MEFNVRSFGEQALPSIPQSSNYSYFTEQALQAGYLGPPGNNFKSQGEMREAIMLELDKERISREIIATEIAKKRAVEEELKIGRQLAVERDQLAYMRRPEERIEMSLEKWLGMRAAAKRGIEGFETAQYHNRRY
ncbi:uncharacterized protein Fot_36299 [Forsythia ovata]|uniref:Uncharacterized protein n=1 Tax=Forsythia ovata TaxID=205694 RepID=A0ABD1SP07_9LAMI